MIHTAIQHILFPDDDSLFDYWKLYYRGDRGRLTGIGTDAHLCMGSNFFTEFNTYLNGLSLGKWKKYTTIEEVTLHLEISGTANITLTGYTLVQGSPERTVLGTYHISSKNTKEYKFTYPDNECTIVGFELASVTEVEIAGGYYEGVFPDDTKREVELSLATTTFQKEEYIRRNTRRMKEGLFDRYPDVGAHIRMHVVDNGRTLKKKDIPDDAHFELHPNPNAGGSGGFARGMIESLHQTPEATHVLLMDDDILILPESIYRTYQLLSFVKEYCKDHFVGGAMMILEEKNIQHENMGHVNSDGSFAPIKGRLDQEKVLDNLKNEQEYKMSRMYQAWWYCCIPVSMIRRNGLPLPVFVRGDDVEYSLRCKAEIISMNGICVWHMGFYGKFNASVSVYQEYRNLWIDRATTGSVGDLDLEGRLKMNFRTWLLQHAYGSCEMALKALEDYMKGPGFIAKNLGESIVKENARINEKLVPFDDYSDKKLVIEGNPYEDKARRWYERLIYRLTYNGHILWPEKWLKKEPVCVPFDWGYTPGKMQMRKTLIAVNPQNRTAAIREIDKRRFRVLQKRYIKDMLYYRKNREKIEAAYREKKEYLTSERFWRKYLGMN